MKQYYTREEVQEVAKKAGVDWTTHQIRQNEKDGVLERAPFSTKPVYYTAESVEKLFNPRS